MAIPVGGEFAARQAAAQAAYERALESIRVRRGKTLQRFGYTETGTVDGTNPYGRLQLIQKDYTDAKSQMDEGRARFDRD